MDRGMDEKCQLCSHTEWSLNPALLAMTDVILEFTSLVQTPLSPLTPEGTDFHRRCGVRIN